MAVLCAGLATPVAFAVAAEGIDETKRQETDESADRKVGRSAAEPVAKRIEAAVERRRDRRQVIDVPGGPSPETLAAIRECESGGDYTTDTGNGFYGAYQFMQGTWEAVGGEGNPAEASPAEQDKRAAILYARSGAGQWPVCGA